MAGQCAGRPVAVLPGGPAALLDQEPVLQWGSEGTQGVTDVADGGGVGDREAVGEGGGEAFAGVFGRGRLVTARIDGRWCRGTSSESPTMAVSKTCLSRLIFDVNPANTVRTDNPASAAIWSIDVAV
jgi:hypothetical protein